MKRHELKKFVKARIEAEGNSSFMVPVSASMIMELIQEIEELIEHKEYHEDAISQILAVMQEKGYT